MTPARQAARLGVTLVLALVLASGCSGGRSPGPPPSAAPSGSGSTGSGGTEVGATPLATSSDSSMGQLTVAVRRLRRLPSARVRLDWTITNGGADSVYYNDTDIDVRYGPGHVSTAVLVDLPQQRRYKVLRSANSTDCFCSSGSANVAPGATVPFYAEFPAPPEGVTAMTVIIPWFSPVFDVPLSS